MFESYNVPENLRPSDPRFGCGPSLIPTSFVASLLETGQEFLGTSHRKPAVKNVVKEVQEGLANFFQLDDDYEVVLGNGGATFLFDMIGLGAVNKKAGHFTCGEFSEKWYKSSAAIPWIEAEQFSVDYGKGIEGEDKSDCDLIAVTLNETSTGVQLAGIPKIDNETLLCVDATSGGGQCPIDVNSTDMFFLSPQKIFASEGGLFINIMSKKARERVLKIEGDKSRYVPPIMNWKTAITNSEKNQTYNTPALATLFFLNEQVKLMNKEGYASIQKQAREKADLIYGWAEKCEYLSPYITESSHRSVAVATIDVDDKVDVGGLLKRLADQKAVYNIDSYRKLGRNQFRIGMFHNIKREDLEKLTQILSGAIESTL
ncbi:MAG: phosphoserine transaminase [Halobacteriovoraceae bacterium]|jgi:phosphoserine aminotransferase|nr:phosphoserine transaminase [Halobacteriovoraceae bacterium]MBT5093279.1 phosphoserine transaminase [Halobacteriovoraceae bacterium]